MTAAQLAAVVRAEAEAIDLRAWLAESEDNTAHNAVCAAFEGLARRLESYDDPEADQ